MDGDSLLNRYELIKEIAERLKDEEELQELDLNISN